MKRSILLLPFAALALAACGDSGTSANGPALVSIRLHDAPGDLKEAWVKVEQVYLQGTSSADSTWGMWTYQFSRYRCTTSRATEDEAAAGPVVMARSRLSVWPG